MHSNHKDLLTVKLLSTIRHYVPNLESHQFIVDLWSVHPVDDHVTYALAVYVLISWGLFAIDINPFTANPVKALHFAILV